MRYTHTAFLILVLGALAACGGSSGDAPPPPAAPAGDRVVTNQGTLAGTYFFVSLSHKEGEGGSVIADTGTFASNGAGAVTITTRYRNDNGAVGGPIVGELAYDVTEDGSIEFRQFSTRILAGGVASDGRFLVAASMQENLTPQIFVAMRQGGAPGQGFEGGYHMAAYVAQAFSASSAFWGTNSFTGGGGVSVSNLFQNQVGTPAISGPEASPGGKYVIGSGGEMTLGMFPGYTLLGGRSHEQVILAGGDILSPIDPLIYVALPIVEGASAATFQGAYWSVETTTMRSSPPTPTRARVSLRSVMISGDGRLTYETTSENLEGAVTSRAVSSGSYAVAADGTLTLEAGALRGGITSSGSFAFAAGDSRDGFDPVFRIFIRK